MMDVSFLKELNSVSNWIDLIRLYSENRSYSQDRYEKYLLEQLDLAISKLRDRASELDAEKHVREKEDLEIARLNRILNEESPDEGRVPYDLAEVESFEDYPEVTVEDEKVSVESQDETSDIVSENVLHRLQLMIMKYFGILPSSLDLNILIPLSSFYDKVVAESSDNDWLHFESGFDWNIIYKGVLSFFKWSKNQFSFWDFLSLNVIVNVYQHSLSTLDKDDENHGSALSFLSGFRQTLYSFVSKDDYSVLRFENRDALVKGINEIFHVYELWDEEYEKSDECACLEKCKVLVDKLFPVSFNGQYYFSGSELEKAVLNDSDYRLDESCDVLVAPAVPLQHKWFGESLSVLLSGKMPKVLVDEPATVHWVLIGDQSVEARDCISVFGVTFGKWNGPVYRHVLNRVVRNEVEQINNGQRFKYMHDCTLDEALDYVYQHDNLEYGQLLPYQVSDGVMFKSYKDVIPYLAANFVLATGSGNVRYPDLYAVVQQYRSFVRESDEVRLSSFRLILKSNNLGFISEALLDDSFLELLKHISLPEKY